MHDAKLARNAVLLQEAHEIASILKASLKTAYKNTERFKKNPES